MNCINTIELNNQAIASLIAHDYEKAIKKFGAALKQTTANFAIDDVNPEERKSHFSIETSMSLSNIISGTESTRVDRKKGYIYNSYIRIPPCERWETTNAAMISVAIIFNLALTYHQMAETSSRCWYHLKKAKKLYELAHQLYNGQEIESVTFIMATINNLGLVYQCLDDTHSAQQCFQQLFQTLMFLVDCGESISSTFEGFFRNTAFLYCKQTAAAAA